MNTTFRMISFCLVANFGFAQTTNSCQEDFKWLSTYIETSLPAFQNDINETNKKAYTSFKKEITSEVSQAITRNKCFKHLTRYTEYFFDNHTRLSMKSSPVDESSEDSILKFKQSSIYKHVERFNLDLDSLTEILNKKPQSAIEGIYSSNGNAYTVAVIKNKTKTRDYVGILLSSISKLWEPGMVKFELKQTKPNTFEALYYYRNHSIVYDLNETIENGVFASGWRKTNLAETTADESSNETPNTLFHFKQINKTTNYLYLKSFDGELSAKYDSLYADIEPKIKALPNLIIDVRDNGGGSDSNIDFLRQLMHTQDYYGGKQQIWNSEIVQKQYKKFIEEVKSKPEIYRKSTLDWAQSMLELLQKNKLGKFVNTSDSNGYHNFKKVDFPKKIVLIQGKGSASTTENLIISGKNSKKTTTIGQNSGGYIGYGNLFDEISPSGHFQLWASTTQNDYKMQFEVVGVAPQIQLSNRVDWLQEAIKLLEKE